MLGFLRIAQEESNPEFRAHMYEYLTELMQDAADNTWEAAKGVHAVHDHAVHHWGDIKKIQKIRKTYARAIVHSGLDNQTKRVQTTVFLVGIIRQQVVAFLAIMI